MPAVGKARTKISRVQRTKQPDHEHADRDRLHVHEHVIDAGRFFDTDRDQRGNRENCEHREQIELCVRHVDPAVRNGEMRDARVLGKHEAVVAQKRLDVARPRRRDRRHADSVFEDEVPPDDPGHELAERRICIGIRAAGNRHHRCEFRITERHEHACEPGKQKRHDDAWTRDRRAHADRREDAAEHRAQAHAHEARQSEHALERGTTRAASAFDRLAREKPYGESVQRAPASPSRIGVHTHVVCARRLELSFRRRAGSYGQLRTSAPRFANPIEILAASTTMRPA